ncbi:MAG: DUF1818 family protein [Phormidium sp. GEM2.Bin31]|nr:MAG: DUF1818 family protein [Phormidium sp. GEM2.Bin31]
MAKILKQGPGWRLGYHPEAGSYVGLLGGDDFAFELTQAEFDDFRRLLQQLSETIVAITPELMDEERITCEVESDHLWMEADGYPGNYRIRIILNHGRRCEGEWPPAVIPNLLQAVKMIDVF